jgi:signal transduction histidine kinase
VAKVESVVGFLRKQPQALLYFEVAVLFGVIAFIDYITGTDLAIYPFYSIPIFFMVWFGNLRAAVFIAIASTVAWLVVDIAGGHVYSSEWLRAWDTLVRLMFFGLVLVTFWSVRKQRDDARARILLLERSQRLEDEIINISEREQQRIGRDLHDGVCQYLVAIGFTASMLKQELEKRSKSDASRVEEIAGYLRDAASRVRQLARGLSPVDRDEGGLETAFEELAASTTKLTGVNCSFVDSDAVPKLTGATTIHLFRIAQEAVSNAVNHGKAKNIVIALDASHGGYSLRISDDGIGFVTPAPEKGGMGLGTMRYRARVIGGYLEIQPNSPSGTVIMCTVNGQVLPKRESQIVNHE